ncbi:MAG TPA: FAD-dependent oxidoreductase [Bryobacteraceae bacterium]|nr:FAD-dependent oxidoreductase [Bryobacteraceae bacterium]
MELLDQNATLPETANLVIIGAGIVGWSAAHFLTQAGWEQVIVLDQGLLFEDGLGSTSHAPGLIFQLNASKAVCQLARWSVALYSELEYQGLRCFFPVGSLEIAYSRARHEELKRKLGHALSWGLPAELIEPSEIQRRIPILNTERIPSALHVPSDGIAKGARICQALAARAIGRGASCYPQTEVTGVEVVRGQVHAVHTSRGTIHTSRLLLCAGIWGPRIGKLAGVAVPLTPVEHQYVKTSPLPQLAGETREVVHPILRHQDRAMYFRQQADCYGIGSYQHEPRLIPSEDLGAGEKAIRPFTPSDFEKPYADALELFPCFGEVDLSYRINGMFSFTPDGNSLMGESADVRGFWMAEAIWVTHGGGAGKAMAEWISTGRPPMDLREMDCNRFHRHAASRAYIRARGAQQYREVYDIIHPLEPIREPRCLRVSPFYERQKELGAVFFEAAGWERPQWFTANENLPIDAAWPQRNGWTAQNWSPVCGVEHQATRERVALFDLTAFTKLEITGERALDFLQSITANQIDRPEGTITYTSLLNDRGGIECDLTVTRLGAQRFWVLTGGTGGPHDLAWIRSHLPTDRSVRIADLTSAYCCLGVWGPRARDLMAAVSDDDFRNEAMPYMTARKVYVGHVPVLALRISYAGELGWEVYAPTEYGLHLWDLLWDAGRGLGLIAAGGAAFDSLRLEKGYRLWGTDIHSDYNPYQAGLGATVRLKKGEFLGRSALECIKSQPISPRLCCLTFDDPQVTVMGKEPILCGDAVLGYVTSSNYGYSVGRSIAYGYLPSEHATEGAAMDIYFFGERHRARITREPLFDAGNSRLKS